MLPSGSIGVQQYAWEAFAKMPHRKPSPPESAAMGGMLLKTVEEGRDDDDGGADEEVFKFLPQQMTSCLPLASMAQKKQSSSPKEAEMGPIDPNPDAGVDQNRRRNRKCREWEKNWVCMGSGY